ncbi:GNAT family N-acetyltransferase [Vibrio sp. SCSIO 43136]|uniref:GNAT family N-acetyltransferase n=1 Tax=Vibrio sp. SCSIO 43136 TaxID=2819101 RepID=UPI002074DF62|nr:GNAT family N-acetyltransferase [Vibrio sp. SCSIO 43136]USD64025.1 GNAT family N-acetyltransferase [Vibrio sp. SCSIO 43136]
MAKKVRIETERLILRQWQPSDYPEYAKLNACPKVMRYFPKPLSEPESNAQASIIQGLIAKRGWGFWAVELKSTGEFIGFIGLHQQSHYSGIPNAPLTEIGWRLDTRFWGKGYAPEGARAALKYAFEQLRLEQVYAFTALQNQPSQRVMVKIGMKNCLQDFDHPKLPLGHELQRHCLYVMSSRQWHLQQQIESSSVDGLNLLDE